MIYDCLSLWNMSSVGTTTGIDPSYAQQLRSSTAKKLYYGGGVRSVYDLHILADSGFDGAIIATAVHKGNIPLEVVQEGSFC